MMDVMARRAVTTRTLFAVLAFVLGLGIVPHRLCERDAQAFWEGGAEVDGLGASVAAWTAQDLAPASFATGSTRFDGEWTFGTYTMAALGFGQRALGESGAARARDIGRMETCLDRMLARRSGTFDRDAWSDDAVASDEGHIAYLGYAGLALSLHRLVAPGTRFDRDEQSFADAIDRRFARGGLVETYPGETYPVDNASALAALAVHARATNAARPASLERGLDAIRDAIDPKTGLLRQSVPGGAPRGSGTALASYFLSYADEATSAALYRALHTELFRTVIGFGAVLEQADGSSRGDIDSGPVVLGFGVSASGFAIGASRVSGDRDAFRALWATAHLFGAPVASGGARTFATGGPLGDAILFAMATAPRRAAP
jgi:hypothetical protein